MDVQRALFRGVREIWPLLSLIVLTVLVAQIEYLGGEVLQREVTTALINMVLVVSLYIFIGNSGVFSFGHIAFMAIGAYATAIMTIPHDEKLVTLAELPRFLEDVHLTTVPATIIAGLVAAVFAAIIALPLMRLSGLAASLATFTVLVIVFVVADNWTALTGGSDGLANVPTVISVNDALVWALVAMVGAHAFQRTRWGLKLRASREDYTAAQAVGIGITIDRAIALVVSAFFAGVGGSLFAQFIGAFTAQAFYLNITFLTLVMLIVGGVASLSGAVIGTIFISALAALLLRVEQGVDVGPLHVQANRGLREVVLAVIMLLVLVLRPRGLTGGREIGWPFVRGEGRAWKWSRIGARDSRTPRAPEENSDSQK
jgi:branched-chain amino acid transport system permease protein